MFDFGGMSEKRRQRKRFRELLEDDASDAVGECLVDLATWCRNAYGEEERVPVARALSEFTRLSYAEIVDILSFGTIDLKTAQRSKTLDGREYAEASRQLFELAAIYRFLRKVPASITSGNEKSLYGNSPSTNIGSADMFDKAEMRRWLRAFANNLGARSAVQALARGVNVEDLTA